MDMSVHADGPASFVKRWRDASISRDAVADYWRAYARRRGVRFGPVEFSYEDGVLVTRVEAALVKAD